MHPLATLALTLTLLGADPAPSAPVPPWPLAARLVEVVSELAGLETTLGDRHPRVVEAKRRQAFLEAAARRGPKAGTDESGRLAAVLRAHDAQLARDEAELLTRYGPRHPELRAVIARRAVLARHLAALPAPAAADAPDILAGLADHARLTGLVAFLNAHYELRHPERIAAEAALADADAQLRARPVPRSQLDAARARLEHVMAAHRTRLHALALAPERSDGQRARLEAELDGLAATWATLPARLAP